MAAHKRTEVGPWWNPAPVQTHVSQLVLQSQEQVGEQARRPLCLLPLLGRGVRGGGEKIFTEVFPDSACGFVQRAHLLAEPGLVVLHHVEDALNVGVNRMAGAGRLSGRGGGHNRHQRLLRTNNFPAFTFPATKGIFLGFGPLGDGPWRRRGVFWGRKKLMSPLCRGRLSKMVVEIKQYSGGLGFRCAFLPRCDLGRRLEVRVQLLLQLWSNSPSLEVEFREPESTLSTAPTWSALSRTSRRSRSSFSSFSSKMASFVWKKTPEWSVAPVLSVHAGADGLNHLC